MGEGVGQRGCGARSEEATAPGWLQAILAEALGGGANLLLVGAKPQDEQKDYERLAETSETLVYVAMTRLMVRRLARD